MTNQPVSVVSDVKGTTTDPVSKAMELLPLGPVMIIDTPGFDDEGALGEMRVKRTRQVLNRVDLAILVVDATVGKTAADEEMLTLFREKNIPYLVAYNKSDLAGVRTYDDGIAVSAVTGLQINDLREHMAQMTKADNDGRVLCSDLVETGDLAILVIPIDKAAPKGRLILPQQQTIRDLLDKGASALMVRDTELSDLLHSLGRTPKLVITDSQAFGKVKEIVPESIPLTSFSILMARYKGILTSAVRVAGVIGELSEGDTVLISEGCTHRRQCGDIGTVKLPALLQKKTGKDLNFAFSSGTHFPEDLTPYRLIIHCGGCMLNEAEMRSRERAAVKASVPMTNYGVAIAYCNGILERSIAMLPECAAGK